MKHFLFSGTLSKVTSSENNATDGMQEVDEDAGRTDSSMAQRTLGAPSATQRVARERPASHERGH